MDDWCTTHHSRSGLTEAVKQSKLNTRDAENAIMQFIQKYAARKCGVLAGNSVHVDRQFLLQEMPEVIEYLHYRIVDVSTIKELVYRWYPALPKFQKAEIHRSTEDILESISELKYYREHCFK
jgi:oligoribonuclease